MTEKEGLLDEISKIKSQLPFPADFLMSMRRLSIETVSAGEYSSDVCAKVNPSDIIGLVQDEIDDIASIIKNNDFFNFETEVNSIGIIKKTILFILGLKEEFEYKKPGFLDQLKQKLSEKKSESDKNGGLYESTIINQDSEAYFIEKKLEIYKTKLVDKKNQLALHKQQIAYLKKSVRDLQSEIAKANTLDTDCIKEMLGNILKEIPSLEANTEQMILVLLKILNFTSNEINKITFERRSKKPTNFLKGIFH